LLLIVADTGRPRQWAMSFLFMSGGQWNRGARGVTVMQPGLNALGPTGP